MSTPRAAGKVVAGVGLAGLRCAKVVGSANESASRINKVCSLGLLIIISLSVAYRSINRKVRRGTQRISSACLCEILCVPLRLNFLAKEIRRDKNEMVTECLTNFNLSSA